MNYPTNNCQNWIETLAESASRQPATASSDTTRTDFADGLGSTHNYRPGRTAIKGGRVVSRRPAMEREVSEQRGGIRRSMALLLLLIIAMANMARAQESGPRYGLFGSGGFVTHTSDFREIPGTESCCMSFTGGSGFGIGGGGLLELPIGSMIVGGRVAYFTHPFDMTTEEGTFLIVDGNGEVGAFEHRLTGSFGTVGIEPTIGVRLFNHLVLSGGVRLAFPVNSSFEQHEQLTQPSGSGTFLNPDGTDSQRRTRNEYSGGLPDMALQIAPLVGIGYELPMNSTGSMLLVPEVSYQFGLTDVLKDVEWKTSMLRVGVALKFGGGSDEEAGERHEKERVIDTVRREVPIVAHAFARGLESRSERRERRGDEEIVIETTRRTDTLFVAKEVTTTTSSTLPANQSSATLSSTISATSVDASGTERPVARITVEEFSSTLMTPLLPYVFFDPGSSAIPDRYNRLTTDATATFDIDAVNSPETLPTYYHLLNIVGKRMQEHPAAKLTVTGTNMDRDEEEGKRELSRARAEQVRNYLTTVWKIADNRIRMEERNLPEKAANTQTDDGAAENRRVELASDDPAILFPIITRDTLRRVDPPVIRFHPAVTGSEALATWDVEATQNGERLRSFNGTERIPATLDWNISRQTSTIPRTTSPISFTLKGVDATGAGTTASGSIDVEQITIRHKRVEGSEDVEVDRFSLILFDVRSSALTPAHGPIIDLIRESIEPNSSVTVTGYTDRLGDAASNQRLAEDRAQSVSNRLGGGSVRTAGVGEADLYNSGLPEARLYTRTVEVMVETPIDD